MNSNQSHETDNNIYWTPAQKELLAELWPDYTITEIAHRLGKSYEGVRGMARRLGLAKITWTRTRQRARRPDKIHPLEIAPGNIAVDARSYTLITENAAQKRKHK